MHDKMRYHVRLKDREIPLGIFYTKRSATDYLALMIMRLGPVGYEDLEIKEESMGTKG